MSSKKGIYILKVVVAMMFASGFFWQCANIGAPQGGPKDTIPPVVMSAEPAFNTVNFDGKRIYIGFDEYIQLKDQQKEFFVSPPMKKNPTLLIKGRGVQIDIRDTLKENTTYALNFGSSIADNNEGNPLHGFRYVFSTGPEVDSMIISGYTVDAYKKDSASKTLIFFYEAAADSMQLDSTLFKGEPAVVARAANNGIFIAQNLKPIDYRIYAVEDKNNNFIYDPGVDNVGFLDSVFNPLDLPDFDAWYDTTRLYMTAEPQLYFRLFQDKQFKRQNLAETKRPSQHKLEFFFNAPFPQIDSLTFEGIDSSQVITEYVSKGRDTMNLWLNVPPEELPDTIKGRITYMRHDSLNVLQPYSTDLSLYWKYVETKEEERAREKLEKDRAKAEADGEEFKEPKKPNPFGVKSNLAKEINPEKNIVLEFGMPLVDIDSSNINLIRMSGDQMFRVKHTLEQDTLDLKRWIISAPWATLQDYKLEIPAGVFTNVAGQQNDSIKQEFSILMADKFGSLTVDVKGKTPESVYVLQLLGEKDNLLQEKQGVKSGKHTFSYLNPGEVKLRVIEDMNGNGKWDAGDLVNRIQPERVEVYYPESGNELITMKVNWEIEVEVDMNDLFKPIDIYDIREQIEKQEEVRWQRILDERAKKQIKK